MLAVRGTRSTRDQQREAVWGGRVGERGARGDGGEGGEERMSCPYYESACTRTPPSALNGLRVQSGGGGEGGRAAAPRLHEQRPGAARARARSHRCLCLQKPLGKQSVSRKTARVARGPAEAPDTQHAPHGMRGGGARLGNTTKVCASPHPPRRHPFTPLSRRDLGRRARRALRPPITAGQRTHPVGERGLRGAWRRVRRVPPGGAPPSAPPPA